MKPTADHVQRGRYRACPRRRTLGVVGSGIGALLLAAVIVSLGGFDWPMVLLASAVLVLGFFAGSRRLASTALFAAVLLGVGVGWLETVNVLDYHTVSLWGPPPKVDWCGRTYLLGGSPVHVPAPLGRLDARWVVVVVTPSGTRLESGVGCGSPRTATLLRAPAGPGTWYLYGLSGGP